MKLFIALIITLAVQSAFAKYVDLIEVTCGIIGSTPVTKTLNPDVVTSYNADLTRVRIIGTEANIKSKLGGKAGTFEGKPTYFQLTCLEKSVANVDLLCDTAVIQTKPSSFNDDQYCQ